MTPSDWRVFRLSLVPLEDDQLAAIQEQLQREFCARSETNADPFRLLFSSLIQSDLEMAGQIMATEQTDREADRRWLSQLADNTKAQPSPGCRRREPAP